MDDKITSSVSYKAKIFNFGEIHSTLVRTRTAAYANESVVREPFTHFSIVGRNHIIILNNTNITALYNSSKDTCAKFTTRFF